MGVGAGLYLYVVVVQKFTFAISSPDEFLSCLTYLLKNGLSTNQRAVRGHGVEFEVEFVYSFIG